MTFSSHLKHSNDLVVPWFSQHKKETSEHVAFHEMLLQWWTAAWLLPATPSPVRETHPCPDIPWGCLLPCSSMRHLPGWPLPSRSVGQPRLFSSAISCWLLDQIKLVLLGDLPTKGKISENFFREHLYCCLRAWHLHLSAIIRLAWKCQDCMKKNLCWFLAVLYLPPSFQLY